MCNVLGFHNPDEKYGFLSNWYLSKFTVDGVTFSSMEQYMMYKKARLFQDTETAYEILSIQDVKQIKVLGRQVKNYDDIIWNGRRQVIIYQGLLEKFCQNQELKKMLLETGNDILAECAVRDCIWGIGLSMTDEKRFSLSLWRGQNLLGFALMEVRDKISTNNL
jgi:ribA/ribD-fused uncharacterized protein